MALKKDMTGPTEETRGTTFDFYWFILWIYIYIWTSWSATFLTVSEDQPPITIKCSSWDWARQSDPRRANCKRPSRHWRRHLAFMRDAIRSILRHCFPDQLKFSDCYHLVKLTVCYRKSQFFIGKLLFKSTINGHCPFPNSSILLGSSWPKVRMLGDGSQAPWWVSDFGPVQSEAYHWGWLEKLGRSRATRRWQCYWLVFSSCFVDFFVWGVFIWK